MLKTTPPLPLCRRRVTLKGADEEKDCDDTGGALVVGEGGVGEANEAQAKGHHAQRREKQHPPPEPVHQGKRDEDG